jgi:outer membrane protein OmpA-like peptidoglycan-associated protein
MMTRNLLLWTAFLAAGLAWTAPAPAQGFSRPPTVQEVLDGLDPPGRQRPPAAAGLSRGIRLPGRERGVTVEPPAEAPPSINLQVPFEFDSATLTPAGVAMLAPLGVALGTQRLAAVRLRIVGHTDARGSEDYNQTLSERRAAAVRGHLLQAFGIDSMRIDAMGRGKQELLDAANPESGINRRVQVINISG